MTPATHGAMLMHKGMFRPPHADRCLEIRKCRSMIYFNCDYTEGCHERILQALAETNRDQTVGYGEDPYCASAREAIARQCGAPARAVHFLTGGTQTNLTFLAAALRPHQGVIAADSGHINVHETGAIEAGGHKVLSLPPTDGKLSAAQIEAVWSAHVNDATHEHMVQPKAVYLSHPTELGTLYSRAELEDISRVCRARGLWLYVDGARLAYALTARDADVDLPDLARLCDAFYIGGTKCGALFGEALVLVNPALREDFRYLVKQRGGMLAKGRLLGVQFLELFRDDLYRDLGRHGNAMADELRRALGELGCPLFVDSPTNQLFPILPDTLLSRLEKGFCFSYQQRWDEGHGVVRLCTSWATREEQVRALIEALRPSKP